MALIKKMDNDKCWQGCREIETLTLLVVGIWNCAAALENILSVPQKVKHRITVWARNATPGFYSREMKGYTHMKTCM